MEALYKINSSEWLAFQHAKQYWKAILYFSGKQDEMDLISLIFILNAENMIIKRGHLPRLFQMARHDLLGSHGCFPTDSVVEFSLTY